MIMKKISQLTIVLLAACFAVSCSELKDDDHYSNSETVVSNAELKIVSESVEQYLANRSDLSSMNSLLQSQGIFTQLQTKGQLCTILAVTNSHFTQPTENVSYITRSHVSDISMSPANLHDGDRMMMWHGKYVNVTIDELGQKGNIIGHVMFNNANVLEVVKTTNGYVYIIDQMINTPTSLRDYINELGDDYSVFRDMVLASGGREFDRANSKAIGINEQGNTVYDSVFIYTNKFFDDQNFDMNSESLTATMLLFSNKVIEDALDEAHDRLYRWGLERSDSLLKDWILKVAFFRKQYTPTELQTAEEPLSSIFSKVWDTKVQKIDTQNGESLSNGVVYKVNKLILPHNVLIYRLKDYFYLYEYCSDEQKTQYFDATNMTFKSCDTEVSAWTPLAGVWPLHENRVLRYDKNADIDDKEGFTLNFTPIRLNSEGTVEPFLIPPGTYRLAMGFVQYTDLTVKVRLYANAIAAGNLISESEVVLGSNTAYHYDRGTTLPNRHPEGYDATEVRAVGGNSKADNYDTDGGMVTEELTIPDLVGDNSPVRIIIQIDCSDWATKTNIKLHHWCLRPLPFNV
jgi:uncharacterized surface protein with fasciclin (FAS1) repeats